MSMSENTRDAGASHALDTAALRRTLTARVWWSRIRNLAIFAVMAVGGVWLGSLLTRSGLSWIFVIMGPCVLTGMIGFLLTLRSIPPLVVVTRVCRKTLMQYDFGVFCPSTAKVDGADATRIRPKKMTLTLSGSVVDASPLMRIDPVPPPGAWRNPWPKGIEDGVYLAGDLPFGAVGYAPSSGAFFLMQPDDWETADRDRKAATSDRFALAEQSGLTQRVI
ncbi:hypothetical protein [Streptomyces sp. JW3]|uniref:hypothetical protein n=1 Tax=Streptomyces sp. JW3 TaxID=3456955 RepID=UPI003FA47674